VILILFILFIPFMLFILNALVEWISFNPRAMLRRFSALG
jgi:hypothetical protein